MVPGLPPTPTAPCSPFSPSVMTSRSGCPYSLGSGPTGLTPVQFLCPRFPPRSGVTTRHNPQALQLTRSTLTGLRCSECCLGSEHLSHREKG